jgi:hypothetical protein
MANSIYHHLSPIWNIYVGNLIPSTTGVATWERIRSCGLHLHGWVYKTGLLEWVIFPLPFLFLPCEDSIRRSLWGSNPLIWGFPASRMLRITFFALVWYSVIIAQMDRQYHFHHINKIKEHSTQLTQ